MSIYELRLESHSGIKFHEETDYDELLLKKLQNIEDFKQKLAYYNKYILSLSSHPIAGQIYIENGLERIQIYCGCYTCRKLPSFKPEHEQIFLELRDKEVNRLVKSINSKKTYKEKLAILLSTKGFYLTGRFTIFPNIEVDLSNSESSDLVRSEPLIDLTPVTREEIATYNEFVRLDFDKRYRQDGGFSKAYKGFNYEEEKQRIENTLKNSVEPKTLIEYVISIIEKHYDYPACVYNENKQSKSLLEVNKHLEESGFLKNLFQRLVLGTEIDLNKYRLYDFTLQEYTHVSEIVKFYAYLKNRLKELSNERLKETEPDAFNEKSKDFTTTRQVLAVHYLLEYMQVRNIDATEKARFVQFLTGKETGAKNIQNTNIYKKVKSPFSLNEKTLIEDLQFIRKHFENLGLNEISGLITAEISKREKI